VCVCVCVCLCVCVCVCAMCSKVKAFKVAYLLSPVKLERAGFLACCKCTEQNLHYKKTGVCVS